MRPIRTARLTLPLVAISAATLEPAAKLAPTAIPAVPAFLNVHMITNISPCVRPTSDSTLVCALCAKKVAKNNLN